MLGPGSRLVRRGDYIWGSFVRPARIDGYIVGVNPGDRADVLGRFSFSSMAVDDAIGASRDANADWSTQPVSRRAEVVQRFSELIEESAEDLAILITRETGKPMWESREEVSSSARVARLLASDGPRWLRSKVLREGPPGAFSASRHRGRHHALHLPASHPDTARDGLAPVGQHGGVRPASSRQRLGRLWQSASIAVASSAACSTWCRAPARRLGNARSHPGIDALVFAGSHRRPSRSGARRSTVQLPTLYQCGKGAAIVLGDADLERAVYDLAISGYATAGQRHNSTARVFVDRRLFDQFCERLSARAQEMTTGMVTTRACFWGH